MVSLIEKVNSALCFHAKDLSKGLGLLFFLLLEETKNYFSVYILKENKTLMFPLKEADLHFDLH